MRKTYTLPLLLLFTLSLSAKAQTNIYHPFPDSNATWCCSYGVTAPPDCYYGYSTYMMRGKKIINSKLYNTILNHDSSADWQCDPPMNYWGSTVVTDTLFIRQDSTLKVVWIYDSMTNTDKILYNFNLSIGDTLDSTKAYFADGLFRGSKIITSIDSVFINGGYRKRFNYNTGCTMSPTDTSMIEGIGALHGLIYPPSCFESGFLLNAFKQNNLFLYGDSTACITGIKDNENKNFVSVFPNPTLDNIFFENLPHEKINLSITDIFGQVIYFTQLENRNTFSLSLENKPAGIYFLSIQSSSGFSINKKIIKQ